MHRNGFVFIHPNQCNSSIGGDVQTAPKRCGFVKQAGSDMDTEPLAE